MSIVTIDADELTALRQREAYYRSIIDDHHHARIFRIRAIGYTLTFVNQASCVRWGRTESELLGQNFADLISMSQGERSQQQFLDIVETVITTGDDMINEMRDYFASSDQPKWIRRHISPIKRTDDTVEEIQFVSYDITDRKQLELKLQTANEQLQQRNQALETSNLALQQFAYSASHDLQTPLRSIVGFAQILQRKYLTQLDDTANQYLQKIIANTKRMQELIQSLLCYARADSAIDALQAVDLNTVVAEVIQLLDGTLSETGGNVTYTQLPIVSSNHLQMQQLLLNLINNCLTYRSDEPPCVHLCATHSNNEWTISVADNGIGIDPKYHEQIFGVFKRLHPRDKYPGTGIGLALCRRIVEQHGGRMWVVSEKGKGSTFYFTFPQH